MAYGFYASITVDNTKVAGSANHTNFPVLISGTYDGTGGEPDIRTVANGGKIQNTASGGAGGGLTVPADFVFSPNTDGSTPYDFEIQEYDATTGKIIAWVEVPTLKFNEDTVFYMVFGDSGVSSSQENVNGTWNTNYLAVWHLNGSYNGTAGEVKDSTASGFNGVAVNTPVQATAKVGYGQDFESTSSQYVSVGQPTSTLRLTATKYSISFWVKPEDYSATYPDNYRTVVGMDDSSDYGGGYKIQLNTDATDTRVFWSHNANDGDRNWRSSKVIPAGSWSHVVCVYDQTNRLVYLNADTPATLSTTADLTSENDDDFRIGGAPTFLFPFDGIIDEVRVSNTNRSADWVTTDYNTQNSPSTFYTVGSETSSGGAGRSAAGSRSAASPRASATGRTNASSRSAV